MSRYPQTKHGFRVLTHGKRGTFPVRIVDLEPRSGES